MKAKRILRTTIPSILIVLTLAVAIVANVMIPPNMNAINGFLGDSGTTTIKQPKEYNDSWISSTINPATPPGRCPRWSRRSTRKSPERAWPC